MTDATIKARARNRPATETRHERLHRLRREGAMRRSFETQSRWAGFVAVLGVMAALGALYLPLL
jgi:cell division septal protein FtsQ